MRIVCAGMYRSGSTWQYNVARLLAGPGHHCGTFRVKKEASEINDLMKSDGFILKTHAFYHDLVKPGVLILTSHRDLRDVAASMRRKFGTPSPYGDMLREIVAWHRMWAKASTYDMRYEDMITDPVAVGRNTFPSL